jgi:putative ABC transport system permease protein
MPIAEAFRLALQSILASKLRSFFTLLGIIVSVGFLVTVVAVIQGMNAYVKENVTGAVIGTNAFQVRRTPIGMGLLSDEEIRQIAKRPLITREDAMPWRSRCSPAGRPRPVRSATGIVPWGTSSSWG